MYRSMLVALISMFACLAIQAGQTQSEGQGASARMDLYGDPLPPDAIARFKPMASYVQCVRFSPDGKRVILGSFDGALVLWDVESGKRIRSFEKAHTGAVSSVSFSPDGKHVISGSWDTTLALWDVESGRRIRTF